MTGAGNRQAARGVAWGTIAGLGRMAATFGVWFFLTPLMIGSLGMEQYGLWSLLFSLVGFLSLLDLGTGAGVVRCVAENRGHGKAGARDEALSTYLASSLAISALGIVVLIVMHLWAFDVLGVPEASRPMARAGLWLIGLRSFVLAMPLGLPRGVLFGENRFVALNAAQTLGTVVTALLIAAALRADGSLTTVAFASLVGMLIEHAFYWVLARPYLRDVRFSWRLVSRRALSRAASLGFSQLVIATSGLVLLRTDPLIVQLFLGMGAVSTYAVAMKVAENTFLLVKQFVNTLSPLVAEWHAADRRDDLRDLLLRATRFAGIPAALIGGLAIGAGGTGLGLWLGPGFEAAVTPMRVLILSMILTVPQMVVFSLLTYSDRHQLPARASIVAAVLNVCFSLAFVKPFGLVGIAAGTLTATALVDVGYVLLSGTKALGVPFDEFIRRALVPVWIPLVLIGAGLAMWLSISPCHELVDLIARIVVVAIGGAVLLYRAALEPVERSVLREKLGRLSLALRSMRWRTA